MKTNRSGRKARHPKREVYRLSRHYRDRIKAVAGRINMNRKDVEKLVFDLFACNVNEMSNEQANEVIARIDRVFAKRLEERRDREQAERRDREQAERLVREQEEERVERERDRVRQIRADRKLRTNRLKKVAKYKRLGRIGEFKL